MVALPGFSSAVNASVQSAWLSWDCKTSFVERIFNHFFCSLLEVIMLFHLCRIMDGPGAMPPRPRPTIPAPERRSSTSSPEAGESEAEGSEQVGLNFHTSEEYLKNLYT
jgi:hypothetical protein